MKKIKRVTKTNLLVTFIVLLLSGSFALLTFISCEKDPAPVIEDPIATFQFEVDTINVRQVTFMNFSLNAERFTWDFGDGNTSTEKDPVHTFAVFGAYTVVLTAFNAEGDTATFSQVIDLKDPDIALALLAGEVSKTWRLYRVGTSLGVGPVPALGEAPARTWWSLTNDGSRPCLYLHEFTFYRDGRFVFNDNGGFWGEEAVFLAGGPTHGVCFAAIASNMVNSQGQDISAWLSGQHTFTYDPLANTITLTGLGAWIGFPHLTTTTAANLVPQQSVTYSATIEQREGYDYMHIVMQYDWGVWSFSYASYSNPALEPPVVLEEEPVVDLDPCTLSQIFNTFAATDAANVQNLIPSDPLSDVTIVSGVADPAGGTVPVGQYIRGTAQFADLKFPLGCNNNFTGFESFSIDVYIPSTNVYDGVGLTREIVIWIADMSMTQQFWTNWVQYIVPDSVAALGTDRWVTYTFRLNEPSAGSVGDPLTRTDLDAIGMGIGGTNHTEDGTFFIRNFRFNPPRP